MGRAVALAALICACGLLSAVEARRTVPTRRTTTTTSHVEQDDGDDRDYHPAEVTKPRLIEQHDRRYPDGHYEYRYVLSNGDTRYERAYWMPVGKSMVLARKGYYSYPLPNREFITVFYTADHNGYHPDSSKFTKSQPVLPRSLDVPEHSAPVLPSPTTVRPPKSQTTIRRRKVTTKAPRMNLKGLAPLQEATTTVSDTVHEQELEVTTTDVNADGALLTTTTKAPHSTIDVSGEDASDSESESKEVETPSAWTGATSVSKH